MKQFVKTLVAAVVVLSVLATMCIVGFSANAGKVHEFVFVDEKAEKKVEDMSNTWESDQNEFSVVNTSDLKGGTSGVPSNTAYQVKVTPNTNPGQTRPGFKAELNGPSTDFSDFVDKPGQLTLDMWIYVSDLTAVNNLVVCFFTDQWYGVNYGTQVGNSLVSFTEYNFISVSSFQQYLKAGWNHVKLNSNLAFRQEYAGNKVVGYSVHEHSGAKGDYTVAVASLKLTYEEKEETSSEAPVSSEETSSGGFITIPIASDTESTEPDVSSETGVSSVVSDTSEVASDSSDLADEGGSFPWWIVGAGVAVVAVAGVAVVLILKKKKA